MARRRLLGALALGAALLVAVGYLFVVVPAIARILAATDVSPGGRLAALASLFLSPPALLLIALAVFLVAIGQRFLGPATPGAEAAAGARERPPVAPVEVPPEESELREGPRVACLRCGSLHVTPLTLADGLFAGGGEALTWVCRRCSWRGPPLQFDSPTAYREFVKGLHESAREEPPP